jgi:hypothetical protein
VLDEITIDLDRNQPSAPGSQQVRECPAPGTDLDDRVRRFRRQGFDNAIERARIGEKVLAESLPRPGKASLAFSGHYIGAITRAR